MRPLWTLEETGLEYELKTLPSPPRFLAREFLEVNPLGTVPCLVDDHVVMTEAEDVWQCLVERYGAYEFGLSADDPDYPANLKGLHRSYGTLTFPQTSCCGTRSRNQKKNATHRLPLTIGSGLSAE